MMTALEFVHPETQEPDIDLVLKILDQSKENGVLFAKAGEAGNIIRVVGPLCLTMEDARKVVQVLEHAVVKYACH